MKCINLHRALIERLAISVVAKRKNIELTPPVVHALFMIACLNKSNGPVTPTALWSMLSRVGRGCHFAYLDGILKGLHQQGLIVIHTAGMRRKCGITADRKLLLASVEKQLRITRTASDSKKSFFAGHVALVSTSTFFMAPVFAEYHPESNFKWAAYVIAGAVTVATAYMRQAAGEHFMSDILLGTAIGTLSGILTPTLHQNTLIKKQRLSIYPMSTSGKGFTAIIGCKPIEVYDAGGAAEILHMKIFRRYSRNEETGHRKIQPAKELNDHVCVRS